MDFREVIPFFIFHTKAGSWRLHRNSLLLYIIAILFLLVWEYSFPKPLSVLFIHKSIHQQEYFVNFFSLLAVLWQLDWTDAKTSMTKRYDMR